MPWTEKSEEVVFPTTTFISKQQKVPLFIEGGTFFDRDAVLSPEEEHGAAVGIDMIPRSVKSLR